MRKVPIITKSRLTSLFQKTFAEKVCFVSFIRDAMVLSPQQNHCIPVFP